ncbi:MAG: hypothetical protein HQM08_05005 [Candidatus Riflebacteria bacterium]|nr:hypothetical protein [Candidatus Riflebacteria bacterium]
MKDKFNFLAVISLFFFWPIILFSQNTPGISEESIIRDVKIAGKNGEESFILFKSALNPLQWFCALMNPKVSTTKTPDGKLWDDLLLFKYQQKSKKDPNKLIEGGILNFSLDIAPSDETIKKLKYKIPEKNLDSITLSPIPLQGLELSVVPSTSKSMIASGTMSPGVASKFAVRKAKFNVPLDKLSTDLLEDLLKAGTGLKFTMKYNFQLLDDPKTLRATVDWDRIKKDSNFGKRKEDIGKYLQIQGATEVNFNPGFTDFLKKRSKEIESRPVKRTATERRDSLKTGLYTIDLEAEEKKNEETAIETISLQRRIRTGVSILAEGFISLSTASGTVYDNQGIVCENHIIYETDSAGWRKAYLMLPSIGQISDCPINKVSLNIFLQYKNKDYSSQIVTWTPEKGWRDRFDAPLLYVKFLLDGLLGLYPNALPDCRFRIEKEITSNGTDILKGTDFMDATAGEVPISTPLEFADVVTLDFSMLSWPKKPDEGKSNPLGISYLDIRLQEGKRELKKVIKTEFKNGVPVIPETLYWLVEKAYPGKKTEKIIPTVQLSRQNGSKSNWSMTGRDIREQFQTMSITFYSEDFQ